VRASQVRGGAVLARARRRRVSGSGAVGWGMAGALNHDRHHAVRPRQHALGGGGETEEGAEVSPQADERPAASRSMDEIQDPTPDNVAAAWLRRSSTVPQVRFRQIGTAECAQARGRGCITCGHGTPSRAVMISLTALVRLSERARFAHPGAKGGVRDLDMSVRWGQLSLSRCSMRPTAVSSPCLATATI
jgi:hypothetical protein